MDNLSLHEIYVRKNYSIKEPHIILNTARAAYLDEYRNKPELITRSIDFLLHIMSKREFLGLLRYTLVLMLSKGVPVPKLEESTCVLSKDEIISRIKMDTPELPAYIVVAMYAYL